MPTTTKAHTKTHTHTHCTHACTHARTHTHTHIHTHACMHAYTHACTHTLSLSLFFLFSLFINDLALDIINNGRHGVSLSSDFVQLVILLFADEMILLSETVVGLKTQLNSLFSAASRLQLKVNMNKSNIVVFRKGGYLGARERWIYDGCMMRVVNSYKYLGICFFYKA